MNVKNLNKNHKSDKKHNIFCIIINKLIEKAMYA